MIQRVSQLYETLFLFEKGKNGEGNGYPIHKRLVFEETNIRDVYEWILWKFDLSQCKEILDAGCGVGFGSLLLAERTQARVTGISISPSEIRQAQANAAQRHLKSVSDFVVAPFAQAPDRKYDLIIAIESLKHSFDLEKSLGGLSSRLAKGGKLVIIEDFYQEPHMDDVAQKYAQDWNLKDAYRLEDYTRVLSNTTYQDLTNRMPEKRTMILILKRRILNFMIWLSNNNEQSVFQIFRGGIFLDELYAGNKMKYGCLVFQEES